MKKLLLVRLSMSSEKVLEKSLLARQQQLNYKNLSEQVEKEWLDISLDLKKKQLFHYLQYFLILDKAKQ